MSGLRMLCGGCARSVALGHLACRHCGHAPACRVKLFGAPEHVAERLARGLGQRGYDAEAVRRALRVEADGALLDATGERLRVLLSLVGAVQTPFVVAPLDRAGNPLAVAAEVRRSWVGVLVMAGLGLVGLVGVGVRVAGHVGGEPSGAAAVADAVSAEAGGPDGAVARGLQVDAGRGVTTAGAERGSTHLADTGGGALEAQARERGRAASVVVRVDGQRVGRGVVVTRQGHVLTQLSLLGAAARVRVEFADGTSAAAVRVRDQVAHDLAVLRVEAAEPRVAVSFGETTRVAAGESVWVVGTMGGGDFGWSRGRVMGVRQWVRGRPAVRVEARAGPRHGGGALFDARGAVIGILTNRTSGSETGYALYAELAYQGEAVLSAVLGRHPRSAAFEALLESGGR